MIDLYTGLYSRFATAPHSSFYNAVGGRCFFGQIAPTSTPYPYAECNIVADTHDFTWTSDFEDTVIDFNLFSDSSGGPLEVNQMYEKLKDQFDDCSLTVTGYSHLRMRRESAWDQTHPDAIPNKTIFQYTVQYRSLIRK